MRLVSCLHPKKIINKYTGEELVVRCGKCEACRNASAANWVQRLDKESSDHKYTMFGTLQYDDRHVPQMVCLDISQYSDNVSYIDSLTGHIISLNDSCISRLKKSDYQFVRDTKILLVHNREDFPKFMKRLRYYLRQLCKHENKQFPGIRYFATAEYGETTYRPHYHFLLFFDPPLQPEDVQKCLLRAWRYGSVYDPHIVSGSSSSYVASYVNSTTNLPAILLHKDIRQKSFFSKNPAIGTLSFGFEEVREIFNSGTNQFRLFDDARSKFRDVPLWRTLRDRCFPRIQRFMQLTHSDRVVLYRLSLRSPFEEFGSAREVAEWLNCYFVRRRERKDFVSEYLREIAFVPWFIDKNGYRRVQNSRKFCIDSLIRFVRIIQRVKYQAFSYGITIDDYVTQIEKFYANCEKSDLSSYIKCQEDYFKEHPRRDYLLLDFCFVQRVNGKEVSCLSPSDKWYLEFYGVIDSETKVVDISFEDSFEYRDLALMHRKIFFNNTKTKSKNDYLYSHSDKFYNVINYLKSLDNESTENF